MGKRRYPSLFSGAKNVKILLLLLKMRSLVSVTQTAADLKPPRRTTASCAKDTIPSDVALTRYPVVIYFALSAGRFAPRLFEIAVIQVLPSNAVAHFVE
jgi:hypothetical protein